MAKASDNLFPYVHLVPAAAPAAPAAGAERVYLDSADGNKLKRKNSSGTVTTVEGTSGTSGMTKIAETELVSAAATISFNSIAGTYQSLRIILTGRSNAAAVIDNVKLYANADTTAANYKNKQFYGTTATGYGTATDSLVGWVPGNTATANEAGSMEILLPHYAKTTFRKVMQSQFYSPGTPISGVVNTVWLNTAAITDLQLALVTGQYMAGTCATLYGMA